MEQHASHVRTVCWFRYARLQHHRVIRRGVTVHRSKYVQAWKRELLLHTDLADMNTLCFVDTVSKHVEVAMLQVVLPPSYRHRHLGEQMFALVYLAGICETWPDSDCFVASHIASLKSDI